MRLQMIDFDSWPPALKLLFLIVPFVSGFAGLALNAQIAMSQDFKIALSAIQSNSYLEQMKPIWGKGGLRSRCLLISVVSALVTFPTFHIYMGWLDQNELKSFPSYLQRIMVVGLWLNFFAVFWTLIGYFIIRGE